MPDRFEDERGVIQDLLGGRPVDAVTEIFTRKHAVRGNHIHKNTIQWTYVVSGHLYMVYKDGQGILHSRGARQGDLVEEPAGFAHAWKAMEDTRVLVFTRGPRSGAAYESDTTRLDTPLLEP